MLEYSNGQIKRNEIPNEITLRIHLDTSGRSLQKDLKEIIDSYAKHISCVELVGGEEEQSDIKDVFKEIHKSGLHTCWVTKLTDESQINKRLFEETDFLFLNNRYYKKEYSPFDDCDMWVNI